MDHLNKKFFELFPKGERISREELKEKICRQFRITGDDLDEILKELEKEGKVKLIKRKFLEL